GSGDGSLNGRVPVRWEKDQLSFNDGFLYSTPGQSGTLRLNGMKGLAPGSRQQVQLDIATEALRDYTYDWAILRLGAQKEHLILSLELAGKPNRPLPFTVDPQTGNFKQTPGQALADFERIGITINFNTPFNAIMKYKDIMRPN
ncbi:MAG: hypothetical protein KJP07_11090, partial [Desulfatitalea sp.]|nr:hypothetical protein [Desulfatitalea sp.]